MGKTLVLAEKPSVGKELARVLGCKQSRDGYMTGGKYIVTWSFGHLVTLADPEVYDKKYEKWELETLPMLPEKMQLVVIKGTGKQFQTVKKLMHSNEVDELVIATDAGREGELVARWIIEKAGCRKPIKRLWISSQTDKAIKEGFASLRPGKDYENLYLSAKCRAEADWLVGLNVTRALTCKFNAQLSAGRVQTPTLAMIVAREEEIKRFVPKDYYYITAAANGFVLTWKDRKTKNVRISQREKADEIYRRISGKQGRVTEVKRQMKREPSPLLYDLTELQRDANKRYGYSAKQTLNIMQRLYENHKLLTYPRTDSRYLSQDIVPTLTDRLKSVSSYFPAAKEILRQRITPTKRFVDDAKVSDHHAIIPTEQYVDMGALSSEERNVYTLAVKRFLSVLSPDFVYEQTLIETDIGGELFTAKGKIVKSKGWKAVGEAMEEDSGNAEEREQNLPEIKRGDAFIPSKLAINTGKTKPPARYTEGTLLTAMEYAGRTVENEAMRDALNNSNGLGTPATRADIIEKLFATNYIEKHGKDIIPTSKGIQLVNLVPVDLKSAELTGKWEQTLTAISKGKAPAKQFISEMREYSTRLVRGVIASGATYRHDNLTKNRCPECGEYLLEVNGKKGKMYLCKNRECGYRQNVSMQSNARCPNCHKRLEIAGSGEKRIYVCGTCGFREKFDSFNKRLSENKSNINKREVNEYMKKQKNEEPLNPAFAEAFAKLKLK